MRTRAEIYADAKVERQRLRKLGRCAQCGQRSVDFYWCEDCRNRRNARAAATKLRLIERDQRVLQRTG